jgi:hypothetical protein
MSHLHLDQFREAPRRLVPDDHGHALDDDRRRARELRAGPEPKVGLTFPSLSVNFTNNTTRLGIEAIYLLSLFAFPS